MDLNETFERLAVDQISEFVRLGQEENLHLEFKTIANSNLRGGDDKRNLAKCISGFANSSGGIIVWGVDARKNAQGIDCASATKEIVSPRIFVSRLNELTGEAVSPVVDGIRHKTIEITPDLGFAATLVPESDSGPYMAKLGDDRYYKRSGDSFYRLEHFDLEDMFGRRQRPRLLVRLNNLLFSADNTQELLRFTLQNMGRAIAKHVGFFVKLENVEIVDVSGDSLQNVSHLNEGRTMISYTNELGVIHPNGIGIFAGHIQFRRKKIGENVIVNVTSYCENALVQTATVVLAPLPTSAEAEPREAQQGNT